VEAIMSRISICRFLVSLIIFVPFVFGKELYAATNPQKGFKIIQFLGDKKAGDFALVGANEQDGVGMGVLLKSYREIKDNISNGSMMVETGELKVVGNRNGYAFAQILKKNSEISKEVFPKFPGPMAGDYVIPSEIKINRQSSILPIIEVSYFNLFEDPNATPRTFELSDSGQERLLKDTNGFKKARVSMIIVEGHTSYKGPSEANQIESYERAKTVRSFLISKYDLDPAKVLAVGYGETILKDKSLTAGHQKRNRRIVVKAVDIDETLINN
jgi:outer membrane protein OmpA-like peptidoglycan-associated protein